MIYVSKPAHDCVILRVFGSHEIVTGRERFSAPVCTRAFLNVGNGDAAVIEAALATLPPEPWDNSTWKAWTQAVAAAADVKGRALYHPLRMALTGEEQGPEMAALLPLIGRARAVARLNRVVV